jgi:hypothetical protein
VAGCISIHAVQQLSASPFYNAMGEGWVYALGSWVECTSTNYDCGNSSPNPYGAYPFIDFHNNYYGILQGRARWAPFPTSSTCSGQYKIRLKKWATQNVS